MTEFGREYGEGLYDLCAEEKIDHQIMQELQDLKNTFRENADFIRLLGNMSLSKEERVSIVDRALAGQVHPYVLNFIKLLVERGAVHAFSECVEAYRDIYHREHRVSVAEVTSARPLTDSQRARLIEKLQQMSGKQIEIHETVDPELLGGILLQMDGKRYDNTLVSRLSSIRQAITGE